MGARAMIDTDAIAIRPMKDSDIDAVLEVERFAFVTPWSRSAFEQELNDNQLARYFVVENNDTVIGYAGMWLVIGEAHITNIAVQADYRRLGVGRLLMLHLINYACGLGIGSMTLEVRVSNDAARKLYASLGFQEKGLRKNYYSETHEDALVLWHEHLLDNGGSEVGGIDSGS